MRSSKACHREQRTQANGGQGPLRRTLLAALLAASAAAPGCGQLYDVKVGLAGADYWLTSLDGHIKVNNAVLPDLEADLKDTLDIEDENVFSFHAVAQLGSFALEGNYFRLDASGESAIDRTIQIGGQSFTAGTNVESDLELELAGGKLKLGILELGPVAVGAVVGVNYLHFDGSAKATALGLEGREKLEAPFPVIGAMASVNQPLGDSWTLFAEAEATGLYVRDLYGINGSYLDVAGRVGARFSVIRLGAGYRFIGVDVEDTDADVEWDVSLGGPFLFAEVAF